MVVELEYGKMEMLAPPVSIIKPILIDTIQTETFEFGESEGGN